MVQVLCQHLLAQTEQKNDVGDAAIASACATLFSHLPSVQGDYIWSFVAELAREAMTVTQNTVAADFHNQIQEAFRREVVLHEVETNTQLDIS